MRPAVACFAAALLSGCFASGAEKAKAPVRIGVVPIQDHQGRTLHFGSIDRKLLSALQGRGFEPMLLRFQPAADVDHQARETGCKYILYTDVVDIRKAGAARVTKAVHEVLSPDAPRGRDIYEAEVELRLFAIDEAQPKLATSVTGRTDRKRSVPAAAAPAQARPAMLEASNDPLTEATPPEETARQRKYKSLAVANALQNAAKAVRERVGQE